MSDRYVQWALNLWLFRNEWKILRRFTNILDSEIWTCQPHTGVASRFYPYSRV